MTRPPSADELALMKFGVGQPVPRLEDPVLVTGRGRYADDVSAEGQAHAVFLRSPYAHGIIRGVDTAAARAMKGVLAVYTAADLAGLGYGPIASAVDIPNADGSAMLRTDRPALAGDKVRYVGDPVAIVVARTAALARDALEAIALDIEELPAVASMEAATAPGAPLVYDHAPGNVVLDYAFGEREKVAEAFARAAHVARLRLVNSRVVVNAMEPRAALAAYDRKAKRYVLHMPSQGAFGMRRGIAAAMGVPPEKVRILTGHVGGSFGMKLAVFPEYVALLHAARELGRPVKWADQRSESFVSDHHGRDMAFDCALALDAKGRFLATRFEGLANMGAYLTPVGAMMPTINIGKNGVGMYRTPLMEVRTRCVLTNTAPIGAYRGAGRPEANYFMERLIDTAAREMGIDRAALRRRNLVTPKQLPWATPAGTTYDSGDFPGLLDKALEAADWAGYGRRLKASRKAGLLRGRGIGCYLEVTAPPANEMAGIAFREDGTVSITTGTLDFGQGHWTSLAQVLTGRLGVPFDRIRLIQGDSDLIAIGGGTGGSKSLMASGKAVLEAGDIVAARGRRLAAHLLEAAEADITFAAGRFRIAGTDRGIGIMELAEKLRAGALPAPPPDLPATLDVEHRIQPSPSAYPNGCHVCEVEIDPDTGVVRVDRYTMANDFGTIVNPLLVEGQLHGGVVQGIGQIIHEMTCYDEAGQLLTGAFTDYTMPRADDAPFFRFLSHPSPTAGNPLGAKGCGEAGCAGSMPSVMNAILDALAPRGVRHLDMPATPLRVWEALRRASAGA